MKWSNSTWIVSGTLLSMILGFQWVYWRSRSIKVTRSRKGQIKTFMFGTRDRCFYVRFSSRMRKMTLKHFFERPKSNKVWKSWKCENLRKQRENCHFRPSKCHKWVIFEDIDFKFCTHIHLRGFFHMFSFFRNSKIFSIKIENNIFCWLLFKISKKFKKMKIWDSTLIAPFILNLLL